MIPHSLCSSAVAAIALAALAATPPALAQSSQALPGDPAAPAASAPATSATSAAPPSWPDMPSPADWRIQVNPRVWYVSPSGKIRLPSSTTPGARIRVEDLNIDTPLASPAGELTLQFDSWRIALSGFNYGIERSASFPAATQFGDVNIAPGGSLGTNFDFTSIQAQLGYRVYDHDFGAADGWPDRTVLRLDLVAGGRFYDLDIDASSAGTTQTVERTFGEAFAGAHAELQIVRDFSIDLDLTAGGYGDSSNSVFSLDVAVAFSWRFRDALALQIGWRQLAYDLTSGEGAAEFEYEGRMAGLFAGLVIRF